MMDGADLLSDDAVEARKLSSYALRILAGMWQHSPVEAVRIECRSQLEHYLLALRSVIGSADAPEQVKADARRSLLAFWDA